MDSDAFEMIAKQGEAADQLLYEEQFEAAVAAYLKAVDSAKLEKFTDQYHISKACLGLAMGYLRLEKYHELFEIVSAQPKDVANGKLWCFGMIGLDRGQVSGRDFSIYKLVSGEISAVHEQIRKRSDIREINRQMQRCCELALEHQQPDVLNEAINSWTILLFKFCGENIPKDVVDKIRDYQSSHGATFEPHNMKFPRLDRWKNPSQDIVVLTSDGIVISGKRNQDPSALTASSKGSSRKPWWKLW